MAKDVDVLIKTEDKPEVDNVTRLIKTMSDSEQSKMLIFLQGVKFAERFCNCMFFLLQMFSLFFPPG